MVVMMVILRKAFSRKQTNSKLHKAYTTLRLCQSVFVSGKLWKKKRALKQIGSGLCVVVRKAFQL